MPRITAAGLAACLIFEWVCPAARAHAQAAEPFQVVPVDAPAPHRHAWAYAGMLGGAALVGSSFFFAHRDRAPALAGGIDRVPHRHARAQAALQLRHEEAGGGAGPAVDQPERRPGLAAQ